MPLVSRKDVLAIAAVIDIALHSRNRPVAAKALAARHKLPPRHLEPVLQALVREGILKGVRGPHGGYALAREHKRMTEAKALLLEANLPSSGDPSADGGAMTRAPATSSLPRTSESGIVGLSRIPACR